LRYGRRRFDAYTSNLRLWQGGEVSVADMLLMNS
jgi:hypothetical protein